MKATVLNSKVGFFRHLILGTVSVHLDTPVTYLLVPRRLTSYSMDTIATKLTTCISGHALAGTLDGLLSKNYRLENLRHQWSSLLQAPRHGTLLLSALLAKEKGLRPDAPRDPCASGGPGG